jgi:hypothetical protein
MAGAKAISAGIVHPSRGPTVIPKSLQKINDRDFVARESRARPFGKMIERHSVTGLRDFAEFDELPDEQVRSRPMPEACSADRRDVFQASRLRKSVLQPVLNPLANVDLFTVSRS